MFNHPRLRRNGATGKLCNGHGSAGYRCSWVRKVGPPVHTGGPWLAFRLLRTEQQVREGLTRCGEFLETRIGQPALPTMDDRDLQAHEERALVVVTLSTATVIASVALLIYSLL